MKGFRFKLVENNLKKAVIASAEMEVFHVHDNIIIDFLGWVGFSEIPENLHQGVQYTVEKTQLNKTNVRLYMLYLIKKLCCS